MYRLALSATLALALLVPHIAHAQASEIPSAAPPAPAGQTSEQRGKLLIDEMVTALGGDAWLNRSTMTSEGRSATFFQGRPNPGVNYVNDAHRFPISGQTEALRQNFLGDRGMILPGKVTDVTHIWIDGHGYEITYKGKTELPKEQVEAFYRNRAHSIEEVVHSWIHAPGVMILYEGTGLVERSLADKVTVLTADNDAVTLELDATSHLRPKLHLPVAQPPVQGLRRGSRDIRRLPHHPGLAHRPHPHPLPQRRYDQSTLPHQGRLQRPASPRCLQPRPALQQEKMTSASLNGHLFLELSS